jgi:hypothetical protein
MWLTSKHLPCPRTRYCSCTVNRRDNRTVTQVPVVDMEGVISGGGILVDPIVEQRRQARLRLQIPVFVRATDVYGEEFLELAKILDISAFGALLVTARPLRVDDIVHLTIPSPSISSSGLIPASTDPIGAKVRREEPAGDIHLVGLEFLKPLE